MPLPRPSARLRFLPLLPLLLLVGSPLLAGCGHPASKAECEEIFRRSAEIELRAQSVNDPEEIERKIAEARAVKGDALLEECVGKRITEEAMQCVRRATTGAELDGCLE